MKITTVLCTTPCYNRTWVTSYRISQYTVYHIKCAKLQDVITQPISSKRCYINIWLFVNLYIATTTSLFHNTVWYCMVSVLINHHHANSYFWQNNYLTVFFSDAQNFAYSIEEVILDNDPCNITENLQSLILSNPWGAQTTGARSPGLLNLVHWHLILVGA